MALFGPQFLKLSSWHLKLMNGSVLAAQNPTRKPSFCEAEPQVWLGPSVQTLSRALFSDTQTQENLKRRA